jgi:hypothetical protein
MFTKVFPEIFRWETQDPEYDWMMVGHLLRKNGELLIVDPPYIHGLEEATKICWESEGYNTHNCRSYKRIPLPVQQIKATHLCAHPG